MCSFCRKSYSCGSIMDPSELKVVALCIGIGVVVALCKGGCMRRIMKKVSGWTVCSRMQYYPDYLYSTSCISCKEGCMHTYFTITLR